jgi:hypothetical protein
MSNALVGLENLPNTYIKTIQLGDANIDVELLMHDVERDGFFVWSDDHLIFDYLKVAIIATSNQQLITGITSGQFSPMPRVIRRSVPLMIGTTIIEIPAKNFMRTNIRDKRRFYKKESLSVPENTTQMTLFALAYIDTQELSNALRIVLTGPLSQYYSSVASDHVIDSSQIQQTTYLYKETSGETWKGPMHQRSDGRWMGGSYHSTEPHPLLVREVVSNTKIIDKRSISASLRKELDFKRKPIFSSLSTSYTNEADLVGMFSLDMRTFVLTKTKHGRKMFNVSKNLFESFARDVSINSFEIRRQQVRLKVSSTKLGTRRYGQKLLGSYKTIAASVENAGRLVSRSGLSQLYMTPDPLIKSYQFTDEEMSERTRGEFRYEVVVTFSDTTERFLQGLISQMDKNVSDLKVQQEFLFRPQRYDRDNNNLVEGTTVPSIFESSIENYCQNLSIMLDIDDEKKAEMIRAKKNAFKADNYTNNEASKFIAEYSALVTKFRRRFDVQKKTERLVGGKKPSKSLAPGMISHNHVFEETVKFDNVVASYDFLGKQSNKSLASFTKSEYVQRAGKEVSRFFNTSRSTMSNDLADLDKDDMIALQDLDSAKFGFLSPLSFKFKSQTKDLTSLQELDSNGISINFINHISEKQNNPRFSSAPVRRPREPQVKKPAAKSRRTFKKKRIGRTKFNFKRTPLKINNLKTEEYLSVSKYLGSNSEMINVETKLGEPTVAPQTKQVELKMVATQGLSVKREKISYDLQSKNNIFEKFKSSAKFDRKKLAMMPIAIKALINSRSTAAKNNILEAESDILKDSETKISTEMIFHTSQKIEYFAGFEMDSNGLPDVSQPMWEDVTPIALENNKRLVCRMRYAQIPELDIKPARELKLLAQNSTFIISDEDIGTLMTFEPTVEPDLEIQEELPEVEEIVYASSNYVEQNDNRKVQLIESSQKTNQSTGGTTNAQSSRY